MIWDGLLCKSSDVDLIKKKHKETRQGCGEHAIGKREDQDTGIIKTDLDQRKETMFDWDP